MKILHNPRCRKSREGLEILKASNQSFEVVRYLDDPLTEEELKEIIEKLGIRPLELIRKNEAIWKSDYRGKNLDDNALLKAMIAHPKLMERPIVVHGDKAVIGRPPELIRNLL
jgi:arsenate reductase